MCCTESLSLIESYIEKLVPLIEELPPYNKTLVEILLLFLVRVSEHSPKNKMTTTSLATVFGQILFRPETETIESMMDGSKITGIMKFMLEKYDKLFPVLFPPLFPFITFPSLLSTIFQFLLIYVIYNYFVIISMRIIIITTIVIT